MSASGDPAISAPRWWESLAAGARAELGFVRLDRVGSTQDWEGLSPERVIGRRAEFQGLVEAVAEGFDAIRPLAWQGDGVMLFVGAAGDPRAWSREAITSAAMRAGLLAITLHEQLLKAGFTVRIAAHAGAVAFDPEPGKMADPEIDRAGHLEHDCPVGAVALSEDVFLSLPDELRGKSAYLGTTIRDGTVAFVCPAPAATRRDTSKFDQAADEIERIQKRFVRYVDSPEIRRLRYVGFRLAKREPPSLDLLQVFTPLDIQDHSPESARFDAPDLPVPRRGRTKRVDEPLRSAAWARLSPGAAVARPFVDVFRQHRHLIVLGDPGSGKSTLLRWLAVTAAGGRTAVRQRLGADERLLPVLVSLGRLFELRESLRRASPESGGPSVVDAMARYFRERNAGEDVRALAAFLEKRLAQGDCLLLLDGLDEVPTERRAEMTAWIESFASVYRENRFVVTSRAFGFAGFDLAGAAIVLLRPFNGRQIRDYLREWHRAYRAWEGNLSPEAAAADRAAADAESQRLIAVIEGDPRLRGLASNPFLLSGIALVHRAEGRLPTHRVHLYDVFARALCETWGSARRLVTDDSAATPRIDYESEAIPILGRLAFWLHERFGSGAAPEDAVRDEIARALVEETGVSQTEARRSAEEFLRRAGEELQIIVPRGPQSFGFLHLTFEEFFAASYLHAKERFEAEAERRWFDARWEEVILLGVGTLAILQKRAVAAGELVRRILGWTAPQYPWISTLLEKQVILAAKACADAPNLATEIYRDVAEAFIRLLVRDRYWVKQDHARRALRGMKGTRFCSFVAERLLAILSQDPDGSVRASAASALGELGDRLALEPLLTSLRKDKDKSTRSAAAQALESLMDPRAMEPLIAALRGDSESFVRAAAAEAVGAVGGNAAFQPLVAALGDEDQSVRRAAARGLRALGDRRAVEPLLAALFRERESAWFYLNAARALKSLGDSSAVEPMITSLRDNENEIVRGGAARLLGVFGDSQALDALVTALRTDTDRMVRWHAALAFRDLGDIRAVEPLLSALTQETDGFVRGDIASTLGALGAQRAVGALLEIMRDDRDKWARSGAAEALGILVPRRAFESLVAALGDKDKWVRRYGAKALGAFGDRRAADVLLQAATDDRDEDVRDNATEALWRLSETLSPATGRKRSK